MSEIVEYLKTNSEIRNKIREELVDLSKQSLSTKARRCEELTANTVVYQEAIQIMGDDIFDLTVENNVLKERIGPVETSWLEDKKEKSKLSYDSEAKGKVILSRLKKQYIKAERLRQLK